MRTQINFSRFNAIFDLSSDLSTDDFFIAVRNIIIEDPAKFIQQLLWHDKCIFMQKNDTSPVDIRECKLAVMISIQMAKIRWIPEKTPNKDIQKADKVAKDVDAIFPNPKLEPLTVDILNSLLLALVYVSWVNEIDLFHKIFNILKSYPKNELIALLLIEGNALKLMEAFSHLVFNKAAFVYDECIVSAIEAFILFLNNLIMSNKTESTTLFIESVFFLIRSLIYAAKHSWYADKHKDQSIFNSIERIILNMIDDIHTPELMHTLLGFLRSKRYGGYGEAPQELIKNNSKYFVVLLRIIHKCRILLINDALFQDYIKDTEIMQNLIQKLISTQETPDAFTVSSLADVFTVLDPCAAKAMLLTPLPTGEKTTYLHGFQHALVNIYYYFSIPSVQSSENLAIFRNTLFQLFTMFSKIKGTIKCDGIHVDISILRVNFESFIRDFLKSKMSDPTFDPDCLHDTWLADLIDEKNSWKKSELRTLSDDLVDRRKIREIQHKIIAEKSRTQESHSPISEVDAIPITSEENTVVLPHTHTNETIPTISEVNAIPIPVAVNTDDDDDDSIIAELPQTPSSESLPAISEVIAVAIATAEKTNLTQEDQNFIQYILNLNIDGRMNNENIKELFSLLLAVNKRLGILLQESNLSSEDLKNIKLAACHTATIYDQQTAPVYTKEDALIGEAFLATQGAEDICTQQDAQRKTLEEQKHNEINEIRKTIMDKIFADVIPTLPGPLPLHTTELPQPPQIGLKEETLSVQDGDGKITKIKRTKLKNISALAAGSDTSLLPKQTTDSRLFKLTVPSCAIGPQTREFKHPVQKQQVIG